MLRISDLITFRPAASPPEPERADLTTIRNSFIPTSESGTICSRIFRRLASFPSRQPGPFLLTGKPGVGKTHLLRQLEILLANPADPSWAKLRDFLPDGMPAVPSLRTVRIEVPPDAEIDLGSSLIRQIAGSIRESGTFDFGELPGSDFTELCGEVATTFASCSVGLLILDDISRRIEGIKNRGNLEQELGLFRILSEVFAECGILVLLVAEEKHLRPDRRNSKPAPLESFAQSCDVLWLGPNNIAEIIGSSIARKNGPQRTEISLIVEEFRRRLPLLGQKEQSFTDIYPIHPQTLAALFDLREVHPAFSPLGFVQTAIEASLDRPAEQFIGLDTLFETMIPELRKDPVCRPLLASYGAFRRNVIPRMKSTVQPQAAALLAGIALSTVCSSQQASVKFLANALLLCDEAGFEPSYSHSATVLLEMEQRGGSYLAANGEKLERRYRLLPAGAVLSPSRSMQESEIQDPFQLQLPLLIYDWISSQIPAWQPEISPKYQHASQSLAVAYPGGPGGVTGLVYFKSVFDPPWLESDLATLQNYPSFWALLVLNPYEPINTLEETLQKLSAACSKIVVWQPDAPVSAETESLRQISASFHLPARPEESDPLKAGDVRIRSREILTSLYVKRGRFYSAHRSWPASGETGNESLSIVLAAVLLSVAPLTAPPGDGQAGSAHPNEAGASVDIEQVLEWAVALTGIDEFQSLDLESAEVRMREWYATSFEPETRLLSATLHPLPDILLTTRFQNEVRQCERYLELLNPLLRRFFTGALEFGETMGLIGRQFNKDARQLAAWRGLTGSLISLVRWLRAFRQCREYIIGAFPTSREELDAKRRQLLEALDQPHRLLNSQERESFEHIFLEYKNGYINLYSMLHEEALQVVESAEKGDSKVDAIALRNLELLSGLRHTNQIYRHRVRIIGKWLRHNQCTLPVREILDTCPRCYCNFNPDGNRHLAQATDQINSVVQEGIEYFRAVLRQFKRPIIEELKASSTSEALSKPIAAILSSGPMGPLNLRSIEVLNRIIDMHTSEFLGVIRSSTG